MTSRISSTHFALRLAAYPNPAIDRVYVDLPDGVWDEIRITDIAGRMHIAQSLGSFPKEIEVALTNLNPGLYSISLIGERRDARREDYIGGITSGKKSSA